ncbi:sugar porter (SP) family MFS transporter [Dinghuibacter silviterrae]|uniref:Sugar porter (SP) family MFS transporter n=2 Tax=Dinghuibacter silviterrae TaxID=1539049 RepID=A0A4R8DF33_9BACT|nr:sugar porter (SP) family MFS transporter [Dinghuibacter silviterrae]
MMKINGELYIILVCMTAGLGGFLFGFDTAVISGAINFLRSQFQLSPVMEGWLMSSALTGCVAGAAIAGYLADRFGRKPVLLLSALLFILSAAGCAVASSPSFLVVARIVGGVGVGFAAMVAPMFISELAPARLRGRLVSLYQLAITMGILCSYLSNSWLLSYAAGHHTGGEGGVLYHYMVTEVWRGMLGSNMVPALLFFLFLLFVPESPRWLLSKGMRTAAERILFRINGPQGVSAELKAIDSDFLAMGKGRFSDLAGPAMRVALIIGLVLPFLSQLSGITTVMYYAPAIFEKAGLASGSAFGSAAVIGFFNMVFTFVAIWKVDKWGRKPLLIGGFIFLAVALLLIGWTFNTHSENASMLLPAFIFYIAIFAATLGPGVWVVLAEIYPTKIRGRAMSLGTLSLFLGSTFVTQTYPMLRESIGIGNVFMLYGLMMLPAVLFVKKLVPETKGKSLEQIEQYWEEREKTFMKKIVLILLLCCTCGAGSLYAQTNYRPHGSKNTNPSYFKKGTVSFVNSSHQDIAWMDSIGACEVWRDENMITPALALMKSNPDYCFSVEDALSLREYLARHPDRYDEILKYTKEGRLEWGGTYNMPYESMYDGEALIRETYLGRKWLKKMLPGCDFLSAWNDDVPGRAFQMPQILSKAGIKYLSISRHEPGIYRWYGPDSSSVLMYTPGQYDGSNQDIRTAKSDTARERAVLNHINSWTVYFKDNKFRPALPILIDGDWNRPNDYHTLFQDWNQKARSQGLPSLTYGTAASVFKALDAPHAVYEPLKGERPNVWLYIHGPTHERALTASRRANRTLVAAEIFSAVDATLNKDFSRYPQTELTSAWEKAIYPDHGWGGKHGDMTDLAFRTKFEEAYAISDKVLQGSLENIAQEIGFDQKGRALVIFNPLSKERTDKVEVSIKVYGQDTVSYKVIDATSGKEVPSQRIESRPAGGTDETITLCFVAEKVPSLGYKTYTLRPSHPSGVTVQAASSVYENKFYRIEFAPGGLKSIVDKALGTELLKTDKLLGGEIFQLQSVGNGAGEFSDVQPVTMEGFEKVSQYAPKWNCTESGPVRKTWELVQQTQFATIRETVTVYDSLKQIDFKADILGFSGERYREYRMAFPLNQTDSRVAYEVPMGVVEVGKDELKGAAGYSYGTQDYATLCSKVHPREVQDWFNASKDNASVTISSSVAVFDWIDPTDSNNRQTVLQPILLASRKSCHWQGNYYLQPGNHHFEFTLTSSAGDWKTSANVGKQQNQPLRPLVVDVAQPRSGLPSSYSFAGTNADNVLITTIKKSEDENSIVMRLVDMQGIKTDAKVDWFGPVTGVTKTNMIEEEDRPATKTVTGAELTITPYSIETIRIR